MADQQNVGFRDPRFDPRCAGSNDHRHFVRNYAFLDEVRQKELRELEQAKRAERDPEKKILIQRTITRIKNKIVERQNKVKKLDLIGEMKSTTDTNQEAPKKYKNIKKSEINKTILVKKFEDLKKSGKLQKYLERKRKKLIKRDGKAFAQL